MENGNKLTVSVAMATYNGEAYLEEQLESIVTQSVLPDEIVIRDDRSNDRTLEIAKAFEANYNEIKWDIKVNDTNHGFVRNFLGAINDCNGDIIILCDQDDVWTDIKVKRIREFFADPKVISMHGNIDIIDKNGIIIKKDVLGYKTEKKKVSERDFVRHLFYCGMSSAFRQTLVEEIQQLDEARIPIHDWLVHALAVCSGGFYTSSEVLVYRRYHENNVALKLSKNERKGLNQRIDVVQYYCRHYNLLDEIFLRFGTDKEKEIFITKVKETNNRRLNYLTNRSIKGALQNLKYIGYYPTKKAFISDILYLLGIF